MTIQKNTFNLNLADCDEDCQNVIVSGFYKFNVAMAKRLRDGHLTASEWRLWSFLITLDPFGDRYIQMPDILTIMSECGVSKASVYRAMAKFQKLGVFDFQATVKFRNLTSEKTVSPARKLSHSCESSLKFEKVVSPVRKPKLESPSVQEIQNPSDSIQTNKEITDSNEELVVRLKISEEEDLTVATPETPAKEIEEIPRQEELRQMGVNFTNSELIKVVSEYQGRIINPIRAFLEYVNKKKVKDPTATFITAVRRGWEPDKNYDEGGLPKKINPPSPEHVTQLEELKAQGKITDFYLSGDGITKVVICQEMIVGKNKVMVSNPVPLPWWDVLV